MPHHAVMYRGIEISSGENNTWVCEEAHLSIGDFSDNFQMKKKKKKKGKKLKGKNGKAKKGFNWGKWKSKWKKKST